MHFKFNCATEKKTRERERKKEMKNHIKLLIYTSPDITIIIIIMIIITNRIPLFEPYISLFSFLFFSS